MGYIIFYYEYRLWWEFYDYEYEYCLKETEFVLGRGEG